MRIGITGYPTYGGSGVVATELGQELAARGHDVHFITYAPPIRINLNHPRIHFHQAAVVQYPLFDHSPYTLSLAVKMLEVFEQECLDILHVHYAIPHSVSALLARSDGGAAAAAIHYDAAWDGHHAGGQQSQFPADYALLDRAKRRRDIHFALFAEAHDRRVWHQAADRSDSQFCELRIVLPDAGPAIEGRVGAEWRTDSDAPFEFSASETHSGCGGDFRAGSREDARQAGDDRRRAGS